VQIFRALPAPACQEPDVILFSSGLPPHMPADELKAWLRLMLTPGIGNETARKLLGIFGAVQAIFEQSPATLRDAGSERLAAALQDEPEALSEQLTRTLAWLEAGSDRQIVALGDPHYPTALLDMEDPPLMLYTLGALANDSSTPCDVVFPDAATCLAVVGSRNPTPQGEANARAFAQTLSASGLCVVSGLALGVDGAAHEGALAGGGGTIAVVGTGLDRVYPKKHLDLAHRIVRNGLLVSEFLLGTPPLTANFPKRNRIIAGLSQATLVVEGALKSGSLITARLAAEQGKDVFAIPGSIHSPQSRGCHLLIKQGAKLVESAQDILEELRPFSGVRTGADSTEDEEESPAPLENALLSALGFDLVSLDALQARTGMPTAQLQAELLGLEMEGLLARLPGGLFQRLATA
jgi:DNA processing protein